MAQSGFEKHLQNQKTKKEEKNMKMKEVLTLREPLGVIREPKDIFGKISKIDIDYGQENVLIFAMRTDCTIIDCEIMFKGGLNACIIDQRTIFRKLLLSNANSFIIAHNHPSGTLNPSPEDITMFDGIKKIGELIGIECNDSIIFTKKKYYSMRNL